MAPTPQQVAARMLNASESAMRRATVQTINRIAASVNSAAASEISKDLALRKRDVTPALRLTKARAADATPQADVIATGKRIPLSAFLTPSLETQYIRQLINAQRRAGFGRRRGAGTRGRGFGGGITYRIGAVKKTAFDVFIAGLKSGHAGVFKRRGTDRLPIDERLGPSIPKSFINRKIQGALRTIIDNRMIRELANNVRFYSNKSGVGVEVK